MYSFGLYVHNEHINPSGEREGELVGSDPVEYLWLKPGLDWQKSVDKSELMERCSDFHPSLVALAQ